VVQALEIAGSIPAAALSSAALDKLQGVTVSLWLGRLAKGRRSHFGGN